jgi:hypothetical protein
MKLPQTAQKSEKCSSVPVFLLFSSLTNPPSRLVTGFQGLTMTEAREVILIHELLHLAGVAGADSKGQSITLPNGQTVIGSAGITAAVRQDCLHK